MTDLIPTPAVPGLELTPVGYRPVDVAAFDVEAMVEVASTLRRVDDLTAWGLGDLYLAIAAAEGEARANEVLIGQGHNQARLEAAVAVAAAVPHDLRRPLLSWSHHVEVRRMDRPAIDRWLRRAQAENLSVRGLRAAIAAETDAARPPLPGMAPPPRPPANRLREALAQSPVVAWVPKVGQLGPARILAVDRAPGGSDRMVVAMEVDPALAAVLEQVSDDGGRAPRG